MKLLNKIIKKKAIDKNDKEELFNLDAASNQDDIGSVDSEAQQIERALKSIPNDPFIQKKLAGLSEKQRSYFMSLYSKLYMDENDIKIPIENYIIPAVKYVTSAFILCALFIFLSLLMVDGFGITRQFMWLPVFLGPMMGAVLIYLLMKKHKKSEIDMKKYDINQHNISVANGCYNDMLFGALRVGGKRGSLQKKLNVIEDILSGKNNDHAIPDFYDQDDLYDGDDFLEDLLDRRESLDSQKSKSHVQNHNNSEY